jgi:hypothetical protein
MSAQLVVKGGPDAGRTYNLAPGITNVGRGPNAQVRISDPSLHGTIVIETIGGIVRVRHDFTHQIYLNRQPFPPGETRTWFHGHELQPTADTVLVMRLGQDSASQAKDPKTMQWVITAGIGLVALVFLAMPADGSGSKESVSKEKPELVQAGLTQLATARPNDPTAVALPKLMASARALELRKRKKEAFEGYARFRDTLALCESRPRKAVDMLSAEEAAALATAKKFINSRLIALSPGSRKDF